ncbi:MAG: DUF4835 family protein [Bacteroidales bacterium]|nr:DUF4835 family protein [Bacteroidales bacterium]
MKRTLASLLALLCLFLAGNTMRAQELKCEIRINSNQLPGTDKTVYQNLQTALYEFVNNTKWTGVNFKTQERIECTMGITLKERTGSDSYVAEINMALRRPCYKASYTTPLFNYLDQKFYFDYTDGQPLDFSPSTHISDLTSTMAFYVYLFLGLDFDSFSLNGGAPFFEAAQQVVNNAQSSSQPGWKAMDSNKNRYWLAENLTNNSYAPLHQFLYEYHRLGLDVMSEKPDEGRAAILNALEHLQTVYESHPTCFFLQLIVESKRDEIIQVFSEGSQQEKTKASNIMKQIDPSKSSQYDAILQGGTKRG